jgi:hypothetical protein
MWPFKPNDWKLVYTCREEFPMYKSYCEIRIPESEYIDIVLFELLYSESRDKYKLSYKLKI